MDLIQQSVKAFMPREVPSELSVTALVPRKDPWEQFLPCGGAWGPGTPDCEPSRWARGYRGRAWASRLGSTSGLSPAHSVGVVGLVLCMQSSAVNHSRTLGGSLDDGACWLPGKVPSESSVGNMRPKILLLAPDLGSLVRGSEGIRTDERCESVSLP
jgi:hypothetical protein